MKYIFHHLGLGDHIICNGMVRHYKEIYGNVKVFCKPHNFINVDHMYRDDKNIEVLSVGEDEHVNNFIRQNNIESDVIRIGFGELSSAMCNTFDEAFYKLANIPFDYRFSKFYFDRDLEKENYVYNQLNPNNEEYIFTHGAINPDKIRKDLKIISNPENFGVFDILKIIELATEVHLMESSIKCMVNSFIFQKPKFFYHQYARGYGEYLNSRGNNNFTTIY